MIHLICNWKQGPHNASHANQLMTLAKNSGVQVTICPPNWYLSAVQRYTGDKLSLGLQDAVVIQTSKNTGSAELSSLLPFEPKYCIVGHSETRAELGLTERDIQQKCVGLLAKNIVSIVCIGYIYPEKSEAESLQIQLKTIHATSTIVAFEPLSAIGTGVIGDIKILKTHYDTIKYSVGETAILCYGGSVDATNIETLHRELGINTFLIGSASIDVQKFSELLAIVSRIDKA